MKKQTKVFLIVIFFGFNLISFFIGVKIGADTIAIVEAPWKAIKLTRELKSLREGNHLDSMITIKEIELDGALFHANIIAHSFSAKILQWIYPETSMFNEKHYDELVSYRTKYPSASETLSRDSCRQDVDRSLCDEISESNEEVLRGARAYLNHNLKNGARVIIQNQ
ncbi:MAG: hypothetical protein KDI30_01720 [Pseudomonadales bacterium]|nr:hypothetical protein [Pseudomonadales bacterium]